MTISQLTTEINAKNGRITITTAYGDKIRIKEYNNGISITTVNRNWRIDETFQRGINLSLEG